MKDILDEAGVAVTEENKQEIDRIIHGVVAVEYKNCSPTWKAVKEHIKGDQKARDLFVKRIRKAVQGL
jgi:cytochrome c551/c552